MDFTKILTEDERTHVGEEILGKLESAYRAELGKAIDEETASNAAKFESLVKVVGEKLEEKVQAAVTENVNRMKTDAINGKLYEALQKITNIVEAAGIPATEVTKRLQEELTQANNNLKQAYQDREAVKKKLNYQAKINHIYALTAGSSPDVINSVIEHFKNCDIREIDRNSVADFIDGNDCGDTNIMDVDVDAGAELNMDKVSAALDEIQDALDESMPGFLNSAPKTTPQARRPKIESAMKQKQNLERVRIPATGIAAVAQMEASAQSPDVEEAMAQIDSLRELGFGGRFI